MEDNNETRNVLFRRIKNLESENALKIIGWILIYNPDEKEFFNLASLPDNKLQSLINQAKAHLGISSDSFYNYPYGPHSLHNVHYAPKNLKSDTFGPPQLRNIKRRTLSEMGACFYYAKGFCKYGENCRFLHIKEFDSPRCLHSVGGFENIEEFESPRSASAELMIGEEVPEFRRCRSQSNAFSAMEEDANSRQIYMTFPPDSTFTEEDVSSYFSLFGPVEDVRIPQQEKRMFAFVTLVNPETVKKILLIGNPHFVRDARVLVKPYRENGRVLSKRQHMHGVESGDIAEGSSPTGIDSQEEAYYFSMGTSIVFNNQELSRRRREQIRLQQAFDLQGRLMNLQLKDIIHQHRPNHHAHPFHPGMAIPSPGQFNFQTNRHTLLLRPENYNHESLEDTSARLDILDSNASANAQHDELREVKEVRNNSNAETNGNSEDLFDADNDYLRESLEHILPDDPFAPYKSSC